MDTKVINSTGSTVSIIWRAIIMMMFFLAVSAMGAKTKPIIDIPLLKTAPDVDGKLNEECWRKAAKFSDFILLDRPQKAQRKTEAYVFCTNKTLFVGFKCFDSYTDRSRRDVVEFFLQPGCPANYYRLTVKNSDWWLLTRSHGYPFEYTKKWRGLKQKCMIKVFNPKDKDYWSVEMSIPWGTFAADIGNKRWSANFCRVKKKKPKEYSSYVFSKGEFRNFQNFAQIKVPKLIPNTYKGLAVKRLRVTNYLLKKKNEIYYALTGVVVNDTSSDKTMALVIKGKTRLKKLKVPADSEKRFNIEVPMSKKDKPVSLELIDVASGDLLYLTKLTEFPILFSAHVGKNYYTTEKNIKAYFTLNAPCKSKEFKAVIKILRKTPSDSDISKTAIVSDLGKALIEIPRSLFKPGSYEVEQSIVNKTGEVVAKNTSLLRIEKPAPPGVREVKIDYARKIMTIDGKPFFAMGIIGIPPKYMKEAATAGFNYTVRWRGGTDTTDISAWHKETGPGRKAVIMRRYLDSCHANGLYVMDVPHAFSNIALNSKLKKKHEKFREVCANFIELELPSLLDTMKRHPAVIGYHNIDEPPKAVRNSCQAYADAIKKIDPYHSRNTLFSRNVRDWPQIYDIPLKDYYGIGGNVSINGTYNAAKKQVRTADKYNRPYWHVPLMEWSSNTKIFITGPAQTVQMYLSVISGARGVLYWMWPARYPANWEALKKGASEIKQLAPALVELTPPYELVYNTPDLDKALKVLIKRHKGKTYIITTNACEAKLTVSFTLPPGFSGPVKTKFEKHDIKLVKNTFKDVFNKYERRVYVLNGEWPDNAELGISAEVGKGQKIIDPQKCMRPKDYTPFWKPGNLLTNSGFEEEVLPGWPSNWTPSYSYLQPGFIGKPDSPWKLDKKVKYEGKQSLCMINDERAKQSLASSSRFRRLILGRGTYEMSAYVKSDKPGAKVKFIAAKGKYSKIFTVSPEWKKYVLVLKFKKKTTFRIAIALLNPGKIWIDNVQLKRTSK